MPGPYLRKQDYATFARLGTRLPNMSLARASLMVMLGDVSLVKQAGKICRVPLLF